MSPTFVIAGSLAVAGALGVIIARAPVHSVIALIVNFIGLAGLYLSLQAEFLAIAQIIIYAGAVMILFLFVIALLTVKREPLEIKDAASKTRLAVNIIAGLVVAILLAIAIVGSGLPAAEPAADDFGTVAAFGRELFTTHVLPFEAAAMVLMVALVGVVILVGRDPTVRGRD